MQYSSEAIKWTSSEIPRFPGTGWKPSKLALLETAPPQRGVEGVCGRRCIFGRNRCRLRAGLPQIAPSPPRLPACKKGQNLGFSPSLTPIWENTVENVTIYFQEPFYRNHWSLSYLKILKSLSSWSSQEFWIINEFYIALCLIQSSISSSQNY